MIIVFSQHGHPAAVERHHGAFRVSSEQQIAAATKDQRGRILQSGTVSAVECVRYALNLPTSVVITGCDSFRAGQLDRVRDGLFVKLAYLFRS